LPLKEINRFLVSEELDVQQALQNAKLAVDPHLGPVVRIWRCSSFVDEPRLHYYDAVFKGSDYRVGAASIDSGQAMLRAIAEGIEQFSMARCPYRSFVNASFSKLGERGLNPESVTAFSKQQLAQKQFSLFRFDGLSRFRWCRALSLPKCRWKYIPAQLVYGPYRGLPGEHAIRFPITTGAATGSALSGAICRGICEVVERDSFMITYLNSLSVPEIVMDGSLEFDLRYLLEEFARCRLELRVFDITTDIPIPTALAVIVDRKGIGPAICIGLKASLDMHRAIVGAIYEAQSNRLSIRKLMKSRKLSNQPEVVRLQERALFWSRIGSISYLGFLLNGRKRTSLSSFRRVNLSNTPKVLQRLLQIISALGHEIYVRDISIRPLKRLSIFTIKAVLPGLQPLYLDERFRYLGGRRLYEVPVAVGHSSGRLSEARLNPIPHPCL
jgi:ribosomal protein S12 methylthiotransferase accessory factor